MKRQLAALDDEDNQDDTASTEQSISMSKRKRTRETKMDVVGDGIQGLISAIDKASAGSKDLVGAMVSMATSHLSTQPTGTTSQQTTVVTQTASEDALDKLRDHFISIITKEEYVNYVGVLENETKARTFLKLIDTTSIGICQKWLKKESANCA